MDSKIGSIVKSNTKKELIEKCTSSNIKYKKSYNKKQLATLLYNMTEHKNNIIDPEESISKEHISNEPIVSNANSNSEVLKFEKDKPYLSKFLKSIKGKTSKYKRVCLSPLRYAGGKTKAIGLILENLPELREKTIVSPFFGGGSFEICASQKLGIKVIGYDVFGMLTNFWDVLINHKDAFIKELKKFHITKEEFTYNRHVLLNYWDTIKPKDLNYKTKKKVELKTEDKTRLKNNRLMQAVYYYYNMTLSYGPMFLGWPSSNEINKPKFERKIKKLENMDLKNLEVHQASFDEILEKHQNDFLFLDPPYYLEGDSKMFKGIYPNSNFAIHHNKFSHLKLAEMLKHHKGGFLITYNNCEKVRELYEGCMFKYPTWQYTYGQGETRIGKNRKDATENKNTNIKNSHEIFIIKWPQ